MKVMKKALLPTIALLAFVALAEKQPIERYQSVIDRQMFGALPRGFDASKLPSEVAKTSDKELTKEQEALKSAIHFSVINVMSDGKVEVGFTDNSVQSAPKHYFIKEGESAGGWTVESVDPESATMVIVKDGVDLTLSLGDDSAKGGGKVSTASATESQAGTPTTDGLARGRSVRGWRMQRERDLQRQADEKAKQLAEESARREAEREAEREARAEEQRQQLQVMKDEMRQRLEEAKKAAEEARAAAAKSGESDEEAGDVAN